MKIKPVGNRILVRLHFSESKIELVKPEFGAGAEEHRTKVECLACGPDVKNCIVGDFLFLHPDALRTTYPTSKEPAEALMDASLVMGIVEDDMAITLN